MTLPAHKRPVRTPLELEAERALRRAVAMTMPILGGPAVLTTFNSAYGVCAGKIEGPIRAADPARQAAEALFSGAKA